jgi:hypothetical protein
MKLWRQRKDEELDAEIRTHLDEAIRDRIARGETPDEARANALRDFGNMGLVKEVTREMWGWGWLERLLQDLRFGLRVLRKNPGFSLVAILTLALAEANFADVQPRNQSFASLAFVSNSFLLAVTGATEAARARVSVVSRQFFDVMSVQPWRRRGFLAEEEKYSGPVAAVVSYRYWQQKLGARADFGAVKLNIDGALCHVVGVMPPGFVTESPLCSAEHKGDSFSNP